MSFIDYNVTFGIISGKLFKSLKGEKGKSTHHILWSMKFQCDTALNISGFVKDLI